MKVGDIVRFHEERFFNGAVQLGWVQQQPQLAKEVAGAFVFHGPRYHGADSADGEDLQTSYRLVDSASFVLALLRARDAACRGGEVNPFLLAIAGYGSGKSHLSVAMTELLSDPAGSTADTVMRQLHNADAGIAAEAQALLAAQQKPMLVLPVDGSAGSFHLGTALSRTVFSQLARAGVDAEAVRALSPRFETASDFVARNHALRSQSFDQALPGRSAEEIRAGLAEQDEETFDAVNTVYLEANGHPIPIEGQESAQALLDTLATQYCGEHGPFSHVLVLFDELGLFLEHAAEHPERAGARALQEIFQGVQDNRNRIHFLGFIQYELKAYLQRFGGADLRHLQRYLTRFDSADKAYLSTNLETLFAHLIHKDEDALQGLWAQANAERDTAATWQRLSVAVPGFADVFPWREQGSFARVIARGCWPLHPLAVWLLTRQSDLIQQRSALAFVKQATTALAGAEVVRDGVLSQVSAAELLLDYMLEQFAAGDRVPGGSVEILLHLLDKHAARLDRPMRLVMTAVVTLDKLRVGRQTREMTNALLCEATALPSDLVQEAVAVLVNMGALDWNDDLAQYELLSDGASRGQFQQWLRGQAAQVTRSEVRNLFVRRGIADCNLMNPVATDFGPLHDIRTSDWRFDAVAARVDTVDQAITQAFRDWRDARLPDAAKGQIVYVFLDEEDDPRDVDTRIAAALARELAKVPRDQAPVWVVAVTDAHGTIGGALARLAVLDERAGAADKDRFRRFIDEERGRIEERMRSATDDAVRQRRYWVAGSIEPPAAPLRKSALAIFEQVYPNSLPFPFDGFATASGNGPKDLSAIAKSLIMGEVNQAWIPAQPASRRGRIDEVLIGSWQALDGTGTPCVPRAEALGALYKALESAHKTDPGRSLAVTFAALIGPPYGMNAASATLLVALLTGLPSPQRGLLLDGTPINAADWVTNVFPRVKAKHYFDEAVLARTRLQLFDEDAESRWRRFLDEWEAEQRIDRIAGFGAQAQERLQNDPVPPSLAERLARLGLNAEGANTRLLEMTVRLQRLQREVEQAVTKASVRHCLKYGHEVEKVRKELADSARWPEGMVRECDEALGLLRETIQDNVDEWIPRQTAHTVAQASDFRHRTEAEIRWLDELGYPRESKALARQAASVLMRLKDLEQHSLTLAQAGDYPRQPTPRGNEPAVALREDAKRGQEIARNLSTIRSLSDQERQAHIAAIERRVAQVQAVIAAQEERLSAMESMAITTEEELREAAANVEQLRAIFAGDRNSGYINELARHLQRIREDIGAWEQADLPPERLAVVLADQIAHQVSSFEAAVEADDDIDLPPWDLRTLYGNLAEERLALARRRSEDWMRPRLRAEADIPTLSLSAARRLLSELSAAPGFLGEAAGVAVSRLHDALKVRIAALEETERLEQIAAWRRRFPDPAAVASLEKQSILELLKAAQEPPAPLLGDEVTWRDQVTEALHARLDALSLDDLLQRITRLPPDMRRQLLQRMQALV
jgi:hypothetical protein